jgi:SAM-dependent methyltransferase
VTSQTKRATRPSPEFGTLCCKGKGGPYFFETRGWSAVLHRLRLRKLLRILAAYDFSGGSYVDVGCCDGFATAQIMRVTCARSCDGLDVDPTLLDAGRRYHPEVRFMTFNLNDPPDGALPRYDFVTCFETIEHVGNPGVAVDNLLALTKPGGCLLITVPIEVGPIGVAKFTVRVAIRGDRLTESFKPQPRLHRRYFRTLLLDQGIHTFREATDRSYWPGHWGFDYRLLDDLLRARGAQFRAFRFLTTRFYEVHP